MKKSSSRTVLMLVMLNILLGILCLSTGATKENSMNKIANKKELILKIGQIYSWINKLKIKDVRGILKADFVSSISGWFSMKSALAGNVYISPEEIEEAAMTYAPRLLICEVIGIDENMVGVLNILNNFVSDNSLDVHMTLEDVWSAMYTLNIWALEKDSKNNKIINEYFSSVGRRIGMANAFLKEEYQIDMDVKRVEMLRMKIINSGGSNLGKNKIFLNKLNNCYILNIDVEQLKKISKISE